MHALAGIHYIELGGEKRALKFGTNQTAIFTELRKIKLSEYTALMSESGLSDIGVIRDLLFSALAAGAKSEKKQVDFDNETVGDWMDQVEDQEKLMEEFAAAITGTANPNDKTQPKEKQELPAA